jgi:hypothetical protein
MPLTAPKTEYQHTRVIVRVDSHVYGMVDLTKDVVQVTTSKSIKSSGKFQVHLIPTQNYMGLLSPDDVVNIYFDPGDGKRGFVRTMFGYIDRIERSESVDSNGGMITRYIVIGSDFQKAIEKTSLYFNDMMRSKLDDLINLYKGTAIIGQSSGFGTALRQAGMQISGSPADFLRNCLQIILGFAQQWNLPTSYAASRRAFLLTKRQDKIQQAKDQLPDNVRKLIASLGMDPTIIDQEIDALFKYVNKLTEQKEKAEDSQSVVNQEQYAAALDLSGNADLYALRTLIKRSADPTSPTGLFDLLNLDFIEHLAIDGYRTNEAMWTMANPTLAQYLYGHAHETINELIFDLRPIGPGGGLADCDSYSTEPDELGINTNGMGEFGITVPAVQYQPSVIFREYPYSVVESIDLGGLVSSANSNPIESNTSSLILLGPVFATPSNQSGRKTYEYKQPLHPMKNRFDKSQKPIKHIDIVKIDNGDVSNVKLGRSDEHVFNLHQIFARIPGVQETYWREMLSSFSPIVNQISIARHGLRTKEIPTEFAVYPGDADFAFPRKNLARWTLLLDHWYQHNVEYLNGTITLRGMPEIRVGYRLDWESRHESYYVDSVNHTWQYTAGSNAGILQTTVEVSRGQRNDPYLSYVYPMFFTQGKTLIRNKSGNRTSTGRLAQAFRVYDTMAYVGTNGPSNTASIETDEMMRLVSNNSNVGYELAYNGKSTIPDGVKADIPDAPQPPKLVAKQKPTKSKGKGGHITKEVLEIARKWALARKLDLVWVINTILIESNGQISPPPNISSNEQSHGLMQINALSEYQRMAKYGVSVEDLYDPNTNIMLGTEIMRQRLTTINKSLNGKPNPLPLDQHLRLAYVGWRSGSKTWNDAAKQGFDPRVISPNAQSYCDNWVQNYPRAEQEVGLSSDPNSKVTL